MKVRNELHAGLFLIGTLILLIVSIWVLGADRQVFVRQAEFFTSFRDIKGLAAGAPVRLGGIPIGRVSHIGFGSSVSDPNVYVTLLINNRYLERIREDSLVSIETQGLLGDRFISLTTGMQGKQLAPGAHMQSQETGDVAAILDKAGRVVENTVQISENVNKFVQEFRTQTVAPLTTAVKSISSLAQQIEKGSGFLHSLIYSDVKSDSSKDLGEIISNIRGITGEIQSGNGLLHALVYDEGGSETVKALGVAAQNIGQGGAAIAELAREIKEGNGFMHQVVYDDNPEGLDDLVRELNQTAENLRRASEALANGSGTLGALLVDSQLYDNLIEVTDGAKRSFLLRQAIRSSLQK